MHQECCGHIHHVSESGDLKHSMLVPHFLVGVAFFYGRCARYAWQLNFERHDRHSPMNLFGFNTFKDAAIGSSIEGYIYLRHHVKMWIKINNAIVYAISLPWKKNFTNTYNKSNLFKKSSTVLLNGRYSNVSRTHNTRASLNYLIKYRMSRYILHLRSLV